MKRLLVMVVVLTMAHFVLWFGIGMTIQAAGYGYVRDYYHRPYTPIIALLNHLGTALEYPLALVPEGWYNGSASFWTAHVLNGATWGVMIAFVMQVVRKITGGGPAEQEGAPNER